MRHNYSLSREAEDETIYNLATKEKRIIITQDDGFRKQVKKKGTGALIIPSYLTNETMDKILTEFISGKDPEDYKGKAIKIRYR